MDLRKLEELEWYTWEMCLRLRRRFPHFKPFEAEIFESWLRHGYLRGYYAFDVRLPVEIERPVGVPLEAHEIYEALSAKRIDVLCLVGGEIWILEVKDRARPSAEGELKWYARLLPERFVVPYTIRLGMICGWALPMEVEMLEQVGIKVWNMDLPIPAKRLIMGAPG